MSLQDKISRYGQGAGTNTSQISGRLESLAKDVENLVKIQGQLEGTAREVVNLSEISGQLEGLAKEVKNLVAIQGVLEGTARSVKTGGSPSGRHEISNIEPVKSNGLAK